MHVRLFTAVGALVQAILATPPQPLLDLTCRLQSADSSVGRHDKSRVGIILPMPVDFGTVAVDLAAEVAEVVGGRGAIAENPAKGV